VELNQLFIVSKNTDEDLNLLIMLKCNQSPIFTMRLYASAVHRNSYVLYRMVLRVFLVNPSDPKYPIFNILYRLSYLHSE